MSERKFGGPPGKVSLAFSKRVKTGLVISQHPAPGTILRRGGAVDLVVSRGHKK
jgi:beta-lactam-binding protein with PASTA domain